MADFTQNTQAIQDPTVGGSGPGTGVTSWNTRTGAVVPESGDYNSEQITEVSWVPAGVSSLLTQNANIISSNLRLYQLATKLVMLAGSLVVDLLGDGSTLQIGVNLLDLTGLGRYVVHNQVGTAVLVLTTTVYNGVLHSVRLPPAPLPPFGNGVMVNQFDPALDTTVASGELFINIPLSLE